MTIKVISPEIKKQYFDGNGDPYSGGKLYIYIAGTTTLVTTYTDEGGLTPNTNPIILNSNGEIGGLYLADGSYKFRLDDSCDVTIWTVDNVTIRDFGQEIDYISDEISDIEDQLIAAVIDPNNVKSGQISTKSDRARYFIPDGSTNEATILATTTNLVFVVDSVEYTLDVDTVISGLNSAPVSNNTAAVNDALLSGQDYTKQLGALGSFILIDTIGSEIQALDGEIAAFKLGNEYLLARVDNTNGALRDVKRGYFYDENNDGIEPVAITDGDTVTLMKLGYIFLKTDENTLITYNAPVYSTTEPSSPTTGDMWYDLTNNKWKRYSSTAFVDATCVYVGAVITDSSGNTVGARPADFYAAFDDENTFDLENVETSVIKVKSKTDNNKISVYGNSLKFLDNPVIWDITTDLDALEVEVASVDVYPYIKEDGDRVMSLLAPYNNLGDLLGYYHPYESWRYIGKVYNNSGSDFEAFTALESIERNNRALRLKTVNTAVDYRCSFEDDVIIVDTKDGDRTIYLAPPGPIPGKKVTIKKGDTTGTNRLTVNTGVAATTLFMIDKLTTVEYISDGSRWVTSNYPIPEILLFKDVKTQGTNAGGASNVYSQRTLNTTEGDGEFAALSGSDIVIQPGLYKLTARAPGSDCNFHKAKLYDETNAADVVIGSSERSSSIETNTWSVIEALLEITVATTYSIQHIAQTATGVSGFGVATNLDVEVYTSVILEKLR